jgi:hypothetical protein
VTLEGLASEYSRGLVDRGGGFTTGLSPLPSVVLGSSPGIQLETPGNPGMFLFPGRTGEPQVRGNATTVGG